MSFVRLFAIARKESIHILRDPRSLGMGIAIPMLMIVLFGYALTLDVDDVSIVVWDQNGTPASRELVARFDGSEYLTVIGSADNYRTIERAIETQRAMGGIVIPYDFDRKLARMQPADIQLLIDGSDANTATLAMTYVEAATARHGQEMVVKRVGSAGSPGLIDFRPRVWFNEELLSKNYIIPGLLAVIMSVIAALLTSLTIAREWETGTMEQLMSTPLRVPEMIFGKLIPYFVMGIIDVILAFLVSIFLFDVPFRGSVVLLFATTSVFLIGVLSFGILISIIAKNQLVANQIAMVATYLPAFLLSGFMFNIANLPRPIQLVTFIIPARYYVAILKGVYLKGIGVRLLLWQIAMLAAFSIIVLGVAHLKLKRKLG